MNIYLYRRDQYIGPYPVENIRDMVAAGQVLVSEPAIQEGSQEWRTVGDFIGAAEPMIHVSQNGEQQGPYTLDQLNAELSKGNVQPTAHGFCDGMTDWVLLTEIPGVVLTRATPFAPAAASAKSFKAKKEDVKQSKSAPKSGNAPSRILVVAGGVAGFAALVSMVWFFFFRGPASPFDPSNPDHAAIEAAVREAASKPEGVITEEDFQKIRKLAITDKKLKDISLLSKLTALEELDLTDNEVENIEALSGLNSLKMLNLSRNKLSDIKTVAALGKLETLDISGNKISDVSPLDGMTGLKDLNAGSNGILDLKPLAGLKSIEFLNLESNTIVDASPLGSLASLQTLNLQANTIQDISGLEGLMALKILMLTGNPVNKTALDSLRVKIKDCKIVFIELPEIPSPSP